MKSIKLYQYITIYLLIAVSCHNLDVPLQNDVPFIVNDTCINKILYYPDTIICTLQVEDLNDKLFQISSIIFDTLPGDSVSADTINWPGNYKQLDNVYDTKEIVLMMPGSLMGASQGMLLITDGYNASVTLPYHVIKTLRDTFDIFSPDIAIWKTYCESDTSCIQPFQILSNYVLRFLLDASQNLKSTGMRSNYRLKGDFCININFGLIELAFEELNGVEVNFIISTSPDTVQWSGIDAGLYLRGAFDRLQVRAAKGLDATSKYINYYSGNMRIEKKDTVVSLYCWQGNPQIVPDPLIDVSFSSIDTLFYVHLKMSVDTLDFARHCIWDNFSLDHGEMIFDKE